MSIRLQDVMLYGGGECFQKFGTPFWRMNRDQDVAATFTRSGSVGPVVGKDGVLRSASVNRLRVDWFDDDDDLVMDTPQFLLGDARTNLVDSDDLTAWSVSGTPQVTGSVDDPAGGTGAYTVEDDDGGAAEFVLRNIGFTGDAVKSIVFEARENTMPASGNQILKIRDTSAAADRLNLAITGWSGGQPTVTETTGSLLGMRYVGNGYWRLYCQATSITATNTNRVEIQPAETAAQTGSIDVYRVNAYDSAVPAPAILNASETRNDETFYANFLHAPREMTVYVKFIELGTIQLAASTGVLQIGEAAASDKLLQIRRDATGFYQGLHDNGPTTVTTTLASAPSYLDTVELRLILNADGSVQIGQSVNAATEAVSTASAANALAAAWSDTRLYLNSRGTSGRGVAAYRAVKVCRGSQSMADMRSLFAWEAEP